MSVCASNWARPSTNQIASTGIVADRREPVRDRRVDRDRVARLEDVLVEADPDLERPAQHVAPFVARVALERVLAGWTRRRPRRSRGGTRRRARRSSSGDPTARPRRAGSGGGWPRAGPAVPAATSCPRRGPGAGDRRRRGDGSAGVRGLRRAPVVEQQLVERDVELGGDRVERADRRVGAAGLDLRDQARRDAQPVGQDAQAQPPAAARPRAGARPSPGSRGGRSAGRAPRGPRSSICPSSRRSGPSA